MLDLLNGCFLGKLNDKTDRAFIWWMEHRNQTMRVAILLITVIAALRLVYTFWRLVGASEPYGANDLHLRYDEVGWWLSDEPVYMNYPVCPALVGENMG